MLKALGSKDVHASGAHLTGISNTPRNVHPLGIFVEFLVFAGAARILRMESSRAGGERGSVVTSRVVTVLLGRRWSHDSPWIGRHSSVNGDVTLLASIIHDAIKSCIEKPSLTGTL